MSGLTVGNSTSYVGAAFVGGYGFSHNSTGSIAFSGTAPWSIHVNKTASGLVTFSGTVPLQGTRATSGALTFSGQFGKQYTKTYGGFLALSGTAGFNGAGSLTHRLANGEITFTGTSAANRTKELFASGDILFTGTAGRNSQLSFIASGTIHFNILTPTVVVKRKNLAASGALDFISSALFVSTTRNSIWVSTSAIIAGADNGEASIWEADATVDTAALIDVVAGAAVVVAGSPSIWNS